jgi:hypothetical protein
LQRLGYGVAAPARVKTEEPLKYSLGRKKRTDPVLRGVCDYVCEVVSYGRWVVEAKGGAETLTDDDAEQAHTYTHHPAVAGFFYLVTNGGLFRLYDRDPKRPLLEWTLGEMDQKWSIIENLLSPAAIMRRAQVYAVDVGKPLAQGMGSSARIVGGFLTYDEFFSSNAQLLAQLSKHVGLRGTFTGSAISRTESGLIRARIEVAAPYKEWDELNKLAGITGYELETAEEAISTDPDKPTIFQGVFSGNLKRGLRVRFPGGPYQRLPLGVTMAADVQAVGYLEDRKFLGTFRIGYSYSVDETQPFDLDLVEGPERAVLDQALKVQPREFVEAMLRQYVPAQLAGQSSHSDGSFEMVVQ